jgi:uncharacterized damage-inducible protein DinB
MTREDALKLFRFSSGVVRLNIQDITDWDSRHIVQDGVNSLLWILGHIVSTRRSMLKLMGAELHWSVDDAKAFSRLPGERDSVTPKSWSEVLEGLDDSRKRVKTALEAFDKFDELAPGEKTMADNETYGDRLNFLFAHEIYHAGQLGILRRLIGKEGQI